MPQYLKEYGEILVGLGYNILPILPGTKRPDLKNWSSHVTTAREAAGWAGNGRAGHGVGVNARHTPAIDVDVMDPQVAEALSLEIDRIFAGQRLMTRTGKPPKFLIPFRSDTPFRKLVSNTYTDGKHDHRIEILGDGQQWVAYHTHPATGLPYRWFDGTSEDGIVRVPSADLPSLDQRMAQSVIDAFELLAGEKEKEGSWQRRTSPGNAIRPHTGYDPFAPHTPPVGISITEVRELLRQHSNDDCDYDQWFTTLAALHHEFGDDARPEAYAWSCLSAKHTDTKFAQTWRSLGSYSGKPATLRSMLKGKPIASVADASRCYDFIFHPGDEYASDFEGGPELVEDVLPERGIAMVYGPSGRGKTFWSLDLAFHVHNGVRWRGLEVKQGDVMYIAAEAGRGIKKRIRAVRALNPDWRAPFIADAAPDLSSLESLQTVRDAARAAGSPVMVVIDTMSASFAGDDSSQKEVAHMIRNLKVLADELECLVMFVHHTTKDGGSFRGSGVLFNDVDAVLELEADEGEHKQWVVQRKHREGEAGKSYPFSLKVSAPLALKPNGKPITSCTVEQEGYALEKKGRKPRTGDFETSQNYAKARHYLGIIQDMCGLETGMKLLEDEVVEAIQADKTVNPMEEPDYPARRSVIASLRRLAESGKIVKEGEWIILI